MPDQTQDNVVRGSLTPPLQNANTPETAREPAPPDGGAAPAGLTIRVGGFGASGASSGDTSGPGSGESVYVTTPGIAAQRNARPQGESAGTQIPSGQEPGFTWGGYFQAMGLLLLMLMALWLALRLVRRFGKGRFLPRSEPLSRDELYLEGALPLGQNRSVCVVRFMGRRLVLGVTEQQISFLTEADGDESGEPGEGDADSPLSEAEFTELMEKMGRGGGK